MEKEKISFCFSASVGRKVVCVSTSARIIEGPILFLLLTSAQSQMSRVTGNMD